MSDSALRGVPLDAESYDYDGQVAWNRDAGVLWDRTRRRLRDRWPSVVYGIVREWQDRGALHLHAVVRIGVDEAPPAAALGEAARTAVAFSKVDGIEVAWGEQVRCDPFRADGNGARAIWYLSKALNYVLKDVARDAGPRSGAWAHLVRLGTAARAMRCAPDCVPEECARRIHDRFGSRSHVVSVSRASRYRAGWSFTGLTRGVQRQIRREWMEARYPTQTPTSPPPRRDRAVESAREQHSVRPRAGAVP